jgi:Na+/melibiose symporter-like transporter
VSFLNRCSQAARRFGDRFSNQQLRVFAVLVLAVHYLLVWALPAFESSVLFVFAVTLLVLTVGRSVPPARS